MLYGKVNRIRNETKVMCFIVNGSGFFNHPFFFHFHLRMQNHF